MRDKRFFVFEKGKGGRKRESKRAVSPVIGTILMIVVVVVIAVVVATFSYGLIGREIQTPRVTLLIEGVKAGSKNVTVVHYGGEPLTEAFKKPATQNGSCWDSVLVKINGKTFDAKQGTVALNGTWDPAEWGTTRFEPADELKLALSETEKLKSGDSITVVFIPTGDVLQRVKVQE